ncbi:hypothetical protein [Ranid herpesvirus 3]|uniref:Uncharacterized protein n=1 Tax=Ranid herpesvirus 3 TaxID=1987509 RepID=A0A1X9T591_9VIRU|nr:hypothetical protein [Ranid herpesvirus 3]ARR28869.1 hypothetical protein [Ranid herpesvirus 3]
MTYIGYFGRLPTCTLFLSKPAVNSYGEDSMTKSSIVPYPEVFITWEETNGERSGLNMKQDLELFIRSQAKHFWRFYRSSQKNEIMSDSEVRRIFAHPLYINFDKEPTVLRTPPSAFSEATTDDVLVQLATLTAHDRFNRYINVTRRATLCYVNRLAQRSKAPGSQLDKPNISLPLTPSPSELVPKPTKYTYSDSDSKPLTDLTMPAKRKSCQDGSVPKAKRSRQGASGSTGLQTFELSDFDGINFDTDVKTMKDVETSLRTYIAKKLFQRSISEKTAELAAYIFLFRKLPCIRQMYLDDFCGQIRYLLQENRTSYTRSVYMLNTDKYNPFFLLCSFNDLTQNEGIRVVKLPIDESGLRPDNDEGQQNSVFLPCFMTNNPKELKSALALLNHSTQVHVYDANNKDNVKITFGKKQNTLQMENLNTLKTATVKTSVPIVPLFTESSHSSLIATLCMPLSMTTSEKYPKLSLTNQTAHDRIYHFMTANNPTLEIDAPSKYKDIAWAFIADKAADRLCVGATGNTITVKIGEELLKSVVEDVDNCQYKDLLECLGLLHVHKPHNMLYAHFGCTATRLLSEEKQTELARAVFRQQNPLLEILAASNPPKSKKQKDINDCIQTEDNVEPTENIETQDEGENVYSKPHVQYTTPFNCDEDGSEDENCY